MTYLSQRTNQVVETAQWTNIAVRLCSFTWFFPNTNQQQHMIRRKKHVMNQTLINYLVRLNIDDGTGFSQWLFAKVQWPPTTFLCSHMFLRSCCCFNALCRLCIMDGRQRCRWLNTDDKVSEQSLQYRVVYWLLSAQQHCIHMHASGKTFSKLKDVVRHCWWIYNNYTSLLYDFSVICILFIYCCKHVRLTCV